MDSFSIQKGLAVIFRIWEKIISEVIHWTWHFQPNQVGNLYHSASDYVVHIHVSKSFIKIIWWSNIFGYVCVVIGRQMIITAYNLLHLETNRLRIYQNSYLRTTNELYIFLHPYSRSVSYFLVNRMVFGGTGRSEGDISSASTWYLHPDFPHYGLIDRFRYIEMMVDMSNMSADALEQLRLILAIVPKTIPMGK